MWSFDPLPSLQAKGLHKSSSRRSSSTSLGSKGRSRGSREAKTDPSHPPDLPAVNSNASPGSGQVGSFMGSALDTLAREQPGCILEAWLVMEFCDLGSLMVCFFRGRMGKVFYFAAINQGYVYRHVISWR